VYGKNEILIEKHKQLFQHSNISVELSVIYDRILSKKLLFRVLLVVFMSAFLPLLVQAYDFESCGDCHEETLAKDKKRLYLHSPFKQEQCGECHAAKASTHPSGEYAVKAFSTGLEDRRKIDWLGDVAICVQLV